MILITDLTSWGVRPIWPLVSFPDPLAIESEAENLSNHHHPGHLVLCSSLCQQMVRLAAGHAAP